MIVPFGNYAKIEVIEDYSGIVRNDASEQQHKGILRDFGFMHDHLTESGGYFIDPERMEDYSDMFENLKGQIVYYQEHADSGRKFTEGDKQFVMIPWYRVYGFEQTDKGAK